jgi:hypothetical protein
MARPGRPKNPPKIKEMLKEVIPVGQIFDEEEEKIYHALVDLYLQDFDEEELTTGDMDDIMGLATNRVLELRLLKSSKGSADKHLDISAAIEKLRKQTEKIKESLSSRRRDRINPNEFKGFSIVNLAIAFDEGKKDELTQKLKGLKKEEEIVIKERGDYSGNRYDADTRQPDVLAEEEDH